MKVETRRIFTPDAEYDQDMELDPEIRKVADSAVILPRTPSAEDIQISLNYLNRVPRFGDVVNLAASGDYSAVADYLKLTADRDPVAKLLLGIVLTSFKADRLREGIKYLEESLSGPLVLDQLADDDFILLSFSDEAVLKFRINSLGAVAILAFAYAVDGDHQAAIDLTSEAYTVTGTEALLALNLWLLRDKGRWEELVAAADEGNPNDLGRFEIQLLRGVALSNLDQLEEAFLAFQEISDARQYLDLSDDEIQSTMPWIPAASRLADELDLSNQDKARLSFAAEDLATEEQKEFDVLSLGLPITFDSGGPVPELPCDTPQHGGFAWADVDLSAEWGVEIGVMPGIDENPGARLLWISQFQQRSPTVLSEEYDAEMGIFSPDDAEAIGFSSHRELDVVSSALLSAAARRPGSAERLARVLNAPEYQTLLESTSAFEMPSVYCRIGDLVFGTARHPDALAITLVANLCASEQVDVAVRWSSWLDLSTSDQFAKAVKASLLYAMGEDQAVLRTTEDAEGDFGVREALLFFRARALLRMSSLGTAKIILDELVRETSKNDPTGGTALSSLYLRSRCHAESGNIRAAINDLDAIQAAQFDYLDVQQRREKLEGNRTTAQTARSHIPKEVKYEVFQRDGGKCVECGTGFDLQYDHVIPVALGGSSSAANLQLLCGDCNRKKGATLG